MRLGSTAYEKLFRRWLGRIPSASRYFATVRRATLMPCLSSSFASLSSLSGLFLGLRLDQVLAGICLHAVAEEKLQFIDPVRRAICFPAAAGHSRSRAETLQQACAKVELIPGV